MPRADDENLVKPARREIMRTRLHRNHVAHCNLAGELTSSSAEIKTRGSMQLLSQMRD